MCCHLLLLDLVGARHCIERAEDRFGKIPEFSVLKTALSHLEKFEFDLASKCLKQNYLNIASSIVYYHVPHILRSRFTSISKERLDKVLKEGKMQVNPAELGFIAEGNFYKISEIETALDFSLDAQRISNLTQIIKFLESQKFTIDKDKLI